MSELANKTDITGRERKKLLGGDREGKDRNRQNKKYFEIQFFLPQLRVLLRHLFDRVCLSYPAGQLDLNISKEKSQAHKNDEK